MPRCHVNDKLTRMDFRAATDLLGLPLADIARELGVSEALVKQARMAQGARGFRSPPQGWEAKIARLLREKGRAMQRAASELDG